MTSVDPPVADPVLDARPWWRRPRSLLAATAIVIVPALIGAALGMLMALGPGRSFNATVLVDGGPGATTAAALEIPPDRADRYVQTELVYIGIVQPEIDAAIRAETGVSSPPPVNSQQVETTNIISMTMVGADAAQAAEMANIAADVYVAGWRERAGADATGQLETVDTQLTAVRQQLADLPAEGGDPAQVAQRDALNAQFQTLSTLRASLQIQVDNVQTTNRIVSPAEAATATRTASPTRNAALWGLLGLVVGAALLLAWRQRHWRSAGSSSD